MSSSGQQILAGRVPGERVATNVNTVASAGFTTTETVVQTVVAPLVIGRRYGVWFWGTFLTTVAGDDLDVKLREDNVSGTAMQRDRLDLISTTVNPTSILYAEYTAVATANKTFVLTGDRLAGSGTINLNAAATVPSYLWVEYIDG